MSGHTLIDSGDGFKCTRCGQYFDKPPHADNRCPGVPLFTGLWKDAFERAEKVLGYKPLTKRQMNDAGFQTGKKLPAPVAAMTHTKSNSGFLFVYNPAEGVPKRQRTQAQIEAHQRMVKKRYYCDQCGCRMETHEHAGDYCDHCAAVCWAQQVLTDGALILDSETTGLDDAEAMQLAIIDTEGHVHLDTLIQCRDAHRALDGAYRIHGIHPDDVQDAPYFVDIHTRIQQIIRGKMVLIYNAAFDTHILDGMCQRRFLPALTMETDCVMHWYAQFVGETRSRRDHRGRWRGWEYKWQRLPYGNHSAVGDCFGTLRVLQEMAADHVVG